MFRLAPKETETPAPIERAVVAANNCPPNRGHLCPHAPWARWTRICLGGTYPRLAFVFRARNFPSTHAQRLGLGLFFFFFAGCVGR